MKRSNGLSHWGQIGICSHLEVIETKIVVIALESHPVRSNPKRNDQTLNASSFFKDQITQCFIDSYWASDVLIVSESWQKVLTKSRIMISPEMLEGVVPRGDDAFRVALTLGQRTEAVRRT